MALDQVEVDELEAGEKKGKEMSFLEHLEELRWNIIRSFIVVVSLGIGFFLYRNWLFESVLFAPSRKEFISYRLICWFSESIGLGKNLCIVPPVFKTQATGFGEPFITAIMVAFSTGFIVAFPYVFWEFWRFVRPGLYPKEQRAARGVVLACSFLFLSGILFGYYIIAPFAINFLIGFTIPGVENIPTISSFITYLVIFTIPTGIVFELPIVVFFLSKVGLVTPKLMRQYRRHAALGILVLAAVITPTTDVITQLLVAFPLFILYEISIVVSRRVEKQKEAEEREEEMGLQRTE
ncbi:MAG: twin-arginine translocase subunit TatC [Saprospiraceae bacterium]|nr:twin-arginine translocase subunit TatC [Saprospiraceae bacterium]MDZ4706475.1 twin-arginine translocase subunit TatC [Saprospiraceae bacterium]